MANRWSRTTTTIVIAVIAVIAVIGGLMISNRTSAQQSGSARPARTADGKPNLNGIWQALNSANWDLQQHAARPGAVVAMGAAGAIPAGLSVIEGGEIPYKPEALKKKQENAANWLERDPMIKCYLPGVPRATYMPFPFQIVQTPINILIAYEYAGAARTVYMDTKEESPLDQWMGWSRGRWEGDTLVVDVTSFNDRSWLDAAGSFHTEALHVVEHYSVIDGDHLMYEATVEDPNVFTRAWKIRMPLYRRIEQPSQLLEFKCVEFVEELMYGHLRHVPTN